MENGMNAIEEQRMSRLQQARHLKVLAKAATGGPVAKAKLILSFRQKLSQHWLILFAAVLFDIFALIPVISIVGNLLFGILLFLYFGPKSGRTKKIMAKGASGLSMQSELMKIGLPVMGLSIVDFFMGVLPANVAAAVIRIMLS